jgi:hypothetical protein
LAATAGFAAWLVWLAGRPLTGAARRAFPGYGWAALAGLLVLEALLALRVPVVVTFFTALIWTAYIPLVDGAVFRLRGSSLLHKVGPFWAMALLSVPAWLIFECYNLPLRNWDYEGVPRHFWVFAVGATWAFATIFAGIFETAELFYCSWCERLRCRPRRFRAAPWVTLGVILLLAPLLAPGRVAPYLFAPVWAGFIFLLDPINHRLGWPSLTADFEAGRPGRFVALLLGGAACGFFWEFWNYWAAARWIYIFPIFHRYRVFQMPFPGFIGFPPFAVECFTLYVFLAGVLLPRSMRTPPGGRGVDG